MNEFLLQAWSIHEHNGSLAIQFGQTEGCRRNASWPTLKPTFARIQAKGILRSVGSSTIHIFKFLNKSSTINTPQSNNFLGQNNSWSSLPYEVNGSSFLIGGMMRRTDCLHAGFPCLVPAVFLKPISRIILINPLTYCWNSTIFEKSDVFSPQIYQTKQCIDKQEIQHCKTRDRHNAFWERIKRAVVAEAARSLKSHVKNCLHWRKTTRHPV